MHTYNKLNTIILYEIIEQLCCYSITGCTCTYVLQIKIQYYYECVHVTWVISDDSINEMWNVITNRSRYLEPHHNIMFCCGYTHTFIRIHFQSADILVLSGVALNPLPGTLDKLRTLKNFVSIGEPKKSEIC